MSYHVTPINDLREHEESTTCECHRAYLLGVDRFSSSLLSQQQRHDKEMEGFLEWAYRKEWRYIPKHGADPNAPWHNRLNSLFDGISTSALLARFREKG
jgi:hypothetical protein